MAPLIGITGRSVKGDIFSGQNLHLAESPVDLFFAEYARKVALAGGLPVMIPMLDMPANYIDRLDALILTGGGDVDPVLWNGPSGYSEGVSIERDNFEMGLLEAAFEKEKPVLAICRGVQLLNVALGGSLESNLPWDKGDQHCLRSSDRNERRHTVSFAPKSILSRVYESTIEVNSFHHQAVKNLGIGLKSTGWSPDGTIESLEHENGRVVGVQWHPEMQTGVDSIFPWLVEQSSL
ncbi:MAG: gamma-glutamyl-gamma-aminobutyrate hydrolase family protein [Actinomycetota bacterium]|nr:gamma-glutamyl-gamma-aminobutyrate hydrolase family protein [Acidimicrobiales bacterium]